MKRLVAGLLALASAGSAWAQEPVLTWNYTGFNSTATVACAPSRSGPTAM